MKIAIEQAIEVNEIILKTINDLIFKTEEENELENLQSCSRFVKGFIDQLKSLQQTELQQRDEFAIEFLDFYGGLSLAQVHGISTQELLEIFKKQQNGK